MKCRRARLFENGAGRDVAAALVFFLISGLALSVGIGGGGLYVPLLMIITGFQLRQATAVSQACLAGGATTALIYNLRQRHPSGQKPMIDYDLLLVMGPNLLIGALIGSALTQSLPSWLILVLLTAVLCPSAVAAFQKAIQTWRKEGVEPANASNSRLSKNPIERLIRLCCPKRYAQFDEKDADPSNPSEGAPPQVVGASAIEGSEIVVEVAGADEPPFAGAAATENESAADSQSSHTSMNPRLRVQYPKRRLAIAGLFWAVVILTIFARGGPATEGFVVYCSAPYWLLALLTAAVLALISLFATHRAIAHGHTPDAEGDGLDWNVATARKIVLWSLLAGILAALCGIGGGMVMGPILLNLGFLPQVQSATTATTLFILSTSTCIAFLVAGTAPLDYSLWLASATGLGAISGKAIIGWLVKRFRRPSMIMFLLAAIISISLFVMLITGVVDVVNEIKEGRDMLFSGLCSISVDD